MNDENSEMTLVHCAIRRENFVAKNITLVLNEVLRSVIKYINSIKANAKCERLFRHFCENENWLLRVKPEMKPLKTVGDKEFVSYLTDIFEKLNLLNKHHQGSNKTLVDAMTDIVGFVTFIEFGFRSTSRSPSFVSRAEGTSSGLRQKFNRLLAGGHPQNLNRPLGRSRSASYLSFSNHLPSNHPFHFLFFAAPVGLGSLDLLSY
ncbi:SCAN domain-containing protein 3 [Trichonephila clavipes]|nr:SCAN domain-containing protein 3 [Trichonephila clavipes]